MLKENVLKTIKKYNLINNGDKIIIGVSGGPDSICLLHVLNSLKKDFNIELFVAHVNHMIREVADIETEYVQTFCKEIDVPCFVKKVNVQKIAKQNKKGTEEVGRDERYLFFNEVLEQTNANRIATAHNSNDKAETVILNIVRGSGISGLKGIEANRDNKYIRPLIETSRNEIEKYCKENSLSPKYDESNNENIYSRNKVRNELIPYIKKEYKSNEYINIDVELIDLLNEYYAYFVKKKINSPKEAYKMLTEENKKKFGSAEKYEEYVKKTLTIKAPTNKIKEYREGNKNSYDIIDTEGNKYTFVEHAIWDIEVIDNGK